MTAKDPRILANRLGLAFANPELLKTALTHRSHSGTNNNERLEFLGDSILGYVTAQMLYDLFPDAREGNLSRLRASLVNESSLAALARHYQLGEHLLLGSGEMKSGGFNRDSILADAMEAIIGALFKDQGIAACQRWIARLFADKLRTLPADSLGQKDPKTRLQELMQAKRLDLPEYRLLTMAGPSHEQTFTVECAVPLVAERTVGVSFSRKRAEQQAAEKMLALLAEETIA